MASSIPDQIDMASLPDNQNLATEATIFQFLDLPAELRNKIYELTFKFKKDEDYIFFHHGKVYNVPVVLLVNKQIHYEAIPLFHSTSRFYVSGPCDLSWLANVTPTIRGLLSSVDSYGKPILQLAQR